MVKTVLMLGMQKRDGGHYPLGCIPKADLQWMIEALAFKDVAQSTKKAKKQ